MTTRGVLPLALPPKRVMERVWVHFDVECMPECDNTQRVYLWGFLLPPAPGSSSSAKPSYRYVWSEGASQDKSAWVAFLVMVREARESLGDIVLVHYSPFEVAFYS